MITPSCMGIIERQLVGDSQNGTRDTRGLTACHGPGTPSYTGIGTARENWGLNTMYPVVSQVSCLLRALNWAVTMGSSLE